MKFSHAKIDVTPEVGTPLAGYGRKPTSSGILNSLYLQLLLIEDDDGTRLLLVSADLIGFQQSFVKKLRQWLCKQDRKLKPSSVMFNATHTHYAPATIDFINLAGKLNPDYIKYIETRFKHCYAQLMSRPLEKGTLSAGKINCKLAMNRRIYRPTGKGKEVAITMAPNHKGPIDPELLVIQVKNKNSDIVVVNYACHPTTMSASYMIHGDYPGSARRSLVAHGNNKREVMFLQGAAGDLRVPSMNEEKTRFVPGSAERVEEYGQVISKRAQDLLKKGLRKVNCRFQHGSNHFTLPYDKSIDIGKKHHDAATIKSFRALSRKRLSNGFKSGVPLEWNYWSLGKDLAIAALPGEVCHKIGKMAKKVITAKNTMFLGYSNGCPCYIPDDKVLAEGGYESDASLYLYGIPHPFKAGVDDILKNNLKKLVAQT